MGGGKKTIEQILAPYDVSRENIIPMLQSLQREVGYISPEGVEAIAEKLHVSRNEIYGVATFYTQFKFHKSGKHQIKVCMGTACHVRNSDMLADEVKIHLGISPGETTEDSKFSLERVACLGCCALAPVVMIDGEVHGKMTRKKFIALLDKLKEEG